jgi:hypothetical protein
MSDVLDLDLQRKSKADAIRDAALLSVVQRIARTVIREINDDPRSVITACNFLAGELIALHVPPEGREKALFTAANRIRVTAESDERWLQWSS